MSVPGEMAMQTGAVAAMSDAVMTELTPEQRQARQAEEAEVKKHWQEYEEARKFDEAARRQYAIDRRYAAGTSDQRWAVNTNLIGSFIDILVSFLYARNPDVSVKKSARVDSRGSKRDEDFAKTMELVVSTLWKRGRLKAACKKQVRSALSVGIGWLKVILICDGPNIPQMQANLRDARDNIARLEAIRAGGYKDQTPEEIDAQYAQANELAASLERRIEVTIRKSLAIDFVAAQDMQVSLDVAMIDDYLNANWCANSIYRLKSELKTLMPKLSEEDCKRAKVYYQRQQKDMEPLTDKVNLGQMGSGAEMAEQYTSSDNAGTSGENGPEFVKIVEKWDHRTNHVYTMVEGVPVWPKMPYQPDYPSTRFQPYFQLSFYPVDGARMPQSLSWRLHKLQDEYASTRSSERITRQRSIPGFLYNKGQVDPADMDKMKDGTHQEAIGIQPTDPDAPMQNLFAPKPVPQMDMRLYDTSSIQADMEKISGVQEALQGNGGNKTATEANIEQTGFASRTDADRDTLEDMLTDLSNYTGEISLSALTTMDAQRIAGEAAFWPQGMDIEDILTLLQIEIEAGSTGKPKSGMDRENWGVLLPQIKELMLQIQQALIAGDQGGAKAMIELMRETFVRLGDETDIERFIPQVPMQQPLAVPGAPGQPPLGDTMVPGGIPDASLQPAGSVAPPDPVGSSTPQLA